jgi:hypothetical protein
MYFPFYYKIYKICVAKEFSSYIVNAEFSIILFKKKHLLFLQVFLNLTLNFHYFFLAFTHSNAFINACNHGE